MHAPLQSGCVYHIFNHANGTENLFREADNYRYFMQIYKRHISPVAETYAWCLMPNHLHLMIRVREENPNLNLKGLEDLSGLVSKSFSNLFNAYSKAFNKKYNRRGSLFQRPFKRKQVMEESYFSQLILYIHQNPLHHGFTSQIDEWPYSSWFSYFDAKETVLAKDTVLEWFGGSDLFKEAHQLFVPGRLVSSLEIAET